MKKSVWYKEPWAWLLVLLPLSAVVAGLYTFKLATTDADTLVAGDYYKKGKAINRELSKVREAQKLGIRFDLTVNDQQLVLEPTGVVKEFSLININFYHPTQAHKDFNLTLTPDGNQHFRTNLPQAITGKWKITLSSFDNKWRIHETIYLPHQGAIDILPELQNAD